MTKYDVSKYNGIPQQVLETAILGIVLDLGKNESVAQHAVSAMMNAFRRNKLFEGTREITEGGLKFKVIPIDTLELIFNRSYESVSADNPLRKIGPKGWERMQEAIGKLIRD